MPEENIPKICPACGKECKGDFGLQAHMRLSHPTGVYTYENQDQQQQSHKSQGLREINSMLDKYIEVAFKARFLENLQMGTALPEIPDGKAAPQTDFQALGKQIQDAMETGVEVGEGRAEEAREAPQEPQVLEFVKAIGPILSNPELMKLIKGVVNRG